MVIKFKNAMFALLMLTLITVPAIFFTPVLQWLDSSGIHILRIESAPIFLQKVIEVAGKLIWSG